MLAKLKLWGAAVLAVIAGVAVAVFYGYTKGKAHAAGKLRKAKQKAADAEATTESFEVRRDVDQKVQETPDAPPQNVGTADPDTAAGKLRDNGWTR